MGSGPPAPPAWHAVGLRRGRFTGALGRNGRRMLKSLLPRSRIDPDGTIGLLRRLLTEYGAPRWSRYAVAFLLMALAAGATAVTAYLSGDVVNQAYVNRNLPAVVQLSLAVLALFAFRGFASYGHAVMLARIANSIVAENQRRLFTRLMQQSMGFFTARHSSELMVRLSTGATASATSLNLVVAAAGRDLLTLVALMAVMVIQDPVMSIFVFTTAPIAVLILIKLIRRTRRVARSQWLGGARTLETLQEAVQGIRTVKSFTLEDQLRSRFDKNVADVQRDSNKLAQVRQRSGPMTETLAGITIALAMIYAGYRVIETGASPGEFFSFMTAFLLAYEPAKRLARLNLDLTTQMVSVRVLFEIIDSPATEPTDDGMPPLKVTTARVDFRDVSFAYRPSEPVLGGISFVAEPGKVTALVGPSGGGKSTILNLILRFYDIDNGTIAIDGQDIRSVSRRSLRNQIAYVGQEVFLFRATIRDNIAFGRPGASDAEIVAAAKAALAHDFITACPNGYDTPLGEHGSGLSGGERQRIAIARALLRNAPLTLLDEATAALDSESEHLVQRAVAELCRGRTTIVVAHRLSTIMHADRILVVEAGRITESGRHDELLRMDGRYASFYRLQLQHQETPAPLAAVVGG